MKLKLEIYLKRYKNKIKRIIHVNDNIKLKDFCEYSIVSMNGTGKHLYQLILNEEYTYLGESCERIYENEYFMKDLTLEDLDLCDTDKLLLNYDFKNDSDFIININKIEEGYFDRDFEVVSGYGCGILEDEYVSIDFREMTAKNLPESSRKFFSKVYPSFKNYDIHNFNVDSINMKIAEYKEFARELNKPKTYEFNIALEGFEKEIKRKVLVESTMNLDDFCRYVVYSMQGDLSHMYALKRGKEYLDEDILQSRDLNYLELEKGQRLKLVYDMGDSWTFKITVSKIIDGFTGDRKFKVISGKGYGIIDDCGGTYELYNIFIGENNDWGVYDLNTFDLDEINRRVDLL